MMENFKNPSSIFIILLLVIKVEAATNKCSLNWSSKLPSWFPLIWNDSSSSIVYPEVDESGSWAISFTQRTPLNIGCSEITNNLKKFGRPVATLKCSKGVIKVGKEKTTFEDFGCTEPPQAQVVQIGHCDQDFDNITIQFESPKSGFRLIDICHNPRLDDTAMSHHIIHGRGLNSFEVSNKRPGFKEAQYYSQINANKAYSQKNQISFIGDLVQSKSLAEKYIDKSKSFYFARGHLAPDGDFVHIYEQNGTYYFINVVPQWQSINNGNWKFLEFAVRRYATSNKVDLQIWTGTRGTLTLPDINGNPAQIYLAKDDAGKLRLPAPEITWKVIYEPMSNSAVAVFTINNPHLKSVPQSLILCPDICSKISWVNWKTEDIKKGYTYCCDLNSAQMFLKFVPDFASTGVNLLT